MSFHMVVMLLAVLLVGVGQTLLKAGARQKGSFIDRLKRLPTLVGYSLLVLAALATSYSLQTVPLRLFVLVSALSYPLITLLSVSLLKESTSKSQLLGIGLILAGVMYSTLG